MKTKNLYFIRHGETDWNREKRFQGQTDIPLNQLGREQALALVPYMSSLKIDAAYSSPLSRAYETAEIALSDLNLQIQKEVRLKETNVGEAEGLAIEALEEKFGHGGIQRWRSYDERDMDFKYPKGESKRQMMIRMRETILEIAQMSLKQNIAIFSHGMAMRSLTFAFGQGVEWDHNIFSNGSIHHFIWDDSRPEFLKYFGKVNG